MTPKNKNAVMHRFRTNRAYAFAARQNSFHICPVSVNPNDLRPPGPKNTSSA
ncbi:hypothetical protein [Bifidobacterium bohemicum]|uniref:hypothetical protein n=1 Tax=Bifidobacterium bohemicum TaxID=638617 RepID=UPI00137784DE|nr:hypothetical protein [Bifidobacterium bohemicum]